MPLGRGGASEPIVAHALRRVLECRAVTDVVVVGPRDPELLRELQASVSRVQGVLAVAEVSERAVGRALRPGAVNLAVVPGGAARSDSVARGLAALPPAVGVVLVHDAARALTPVEVFDRVVDAVHRGHSAVTPALPVVDTIKQVVVGPTGEETVVATVDRSSLRAVQTPQGFLRETLERAHAERGPGRDGESGAPATDDCGMVEAHGGRVTVVAGSPRAMKITTPHDLEVAAGWLEER
ncbi:MULTISPECIES: 2-C-methyl-D-erythritol 4-phosphate cytidylyltransferase [unclassified Ornithinimicrobium]|uniref:IspD/TarI family cytidylyltransferase n=1 Tax=unclassified Ornithinimicrobium TaxID=2615080 RepID=UPI0038534950